MGQTHTHAHPCTHARVVCVLCVALRCMLLCTRLKLIISTSPSSPPTHTQSPLYTISLIIESKDKHTVLHTLTQRQTLNSRALIVEILFFAFRIIPRRKEASRQTRTLYLKSKTTIKRLNTKQKTVNKKR